MAFHRILSCLSLAAAILITGGQVAWAHPGHGASESPFGIWHYITSSQHLLAAALAAGISAAGITIARSILAKRRLARRRISAR